MYGVLINSSNTGADSEIAIAFATPINISSNQPFFSSDTISLRQFITEQSAQRWEISSEVVPTRDHKGRLVAAMMFNFRKLGYIYIRTPQIFMDSYTLPDSLQITTTTTKSGGADQIPIALSNPGFNDSDQLLAGCFIKFENHFKIYFVNSVHLGTMNIYPGLVSEVPAGARIYSGKLATMRARIDTNNFVGIKYTDGILVNNGEYKFIEAL